MEVEVKMLRWKIGEISFDEIREEMRPKENRLEVIERDVRVCDVDGGIVIADRDKNKISWIKTYVKERRIL